VGLYQRKEKDYAQRKNKVPLTEQQSDSVDQIGKIAINNENY
jgi:hypothetical protein